MEPQDQPRNNAVKTIQARDVTDLYVALYKHFMKVRGADPGTKTGTHEPATTNLDVMQLAARWTKPVLKTGTDHDTDRVRRKAWLACVTAVHNQADVQHRPNELYPDNKAFWGCMRKTSIWLDARQFRPDKWDLVWDSLDEAVRGLPGTLSSVASAGGRAAGDVADTTGSAAKAIGRGVADFLGEPIRLVAVLVGGAILIPPVVRAFRD